MRVEVVEEFPPLPHISLRSRALLTWLYNNQLCTMPQCVKRHMTRLLRSIKVAERFSLAHVLFVMHLWSSKLLMSTSSFFLASPPRLVYNDRHQATCSSLSLHNADIADSILENAENHFIFLEYCRGIFLSITLKLPSWMFVSPWNTVK